MTSWGGRLGGHSARRRRRRLLEILLALALAVAATAFDSHAWSVLTVFDVLAVELEVVLGEQDELLLLGLGLGLGLGVGVGFGFELGCSLVLRPPSSIRRIACEM